MADKQAPTILSFIYEGSPPSLSPWEKAKIGALEREADLAAKAYLPAQGDAALREAQGIKVDSWHRMNPSVIRWLPPDEYDTWKDLFTNVCDIYESGFAERLPEDVLSKIPEWREAFTSMLLHSNAEGDRILMGCFESKAAILAMWRIDQTSPLQPREMQAVVTYRKTSARYGRNQKTISWLLCGMTLILAGVASVLGRSIPFWRDAPMEDMGLTIFFVVLTLTLLILCIGSLRKFLLLKKLRRAFLHDHRALASRL